MPGPVPIVKLPQGVAYREASILQDNPFLAALSSGADQGVGDPSVAAAEAMFPARRSRDIVLPMETPLPTPVPRPAQPPEPHPAIAALTAAQSAPTPDALRAGFKGSLDDVDWGSEIAGFLAQGNADREAEDAGYQRMAQNALMPQGRSAIDAVSDDVRFGGLQRARDMQNPAFARRQRQEDALAGAETYADPRMAAMRTAQRTENLTDKAAQHELAIKFGLDPRDIELDEREHRQALELAQARNQLGGLLGMGGGQPAAPQGGGRAMTEQQIRQEVLAGGGTENDVLDTMAKFKAAGLLR